MRDPSDFLIVPSEVDFEFFMRLEILFESDFASNRGVSTSICRAINRAARFAF